jgi:hypothetical protein
MTNNELAILAIFIRVETAYQHIKKKPQTTSYAANQMKSGFSALTKV